MLEELNAVTPAERLEVALAHIRQQAARVLAIDETNLPDPRRTLNELGFDSLTAVEFANRVGRSIGQQINPALLFDYPTLESLAGYVVRARWRPRSPKPLRRRQRRSRPPTKSVPRPPAEVEGMSEEEMEAVVSKQLEQLQT